MDDRARLRTTFDEDARLYDAVRPTYPEDLFDDLVALAGMPPRGRVLEIGPGTGQATLPLARRGFRVLGIELGSSMARVARENLAAYPEAHIWEGTFEDWPVERAAFDVVLSATAFHWIDPTVGYRKAHDALGPGGSLALIATAHVANPDDGGFFERAQRVYEREAPELVKPGERMWTAAEFPDDAAAIAASGLFGPVAVRRYPALLTYDSAGYRRLLLTYSGHRALEPGKREALLRGLTDLIDGAFGGSVTKGYLFVLHVARAA